MFKTYQSIVKSSSHTLIIAVTLCGISLLLNSCETYKYMRDPDASERAEALERSALLAESEANMQPDGLTTEGLPNSGPAAFYNEFPEGTNPPATSVIESPESAEGGSDKDYDRWVHGPDGLLVPASSLKKDETSEAAAENDTAPQNPNQVLPE